MMEININSKIEIAKLVTKIENHDDDLSTWAIKNIKGAQIIGITGVFGSGKSTLISKLAVKFLSEGKRVAVLGVDPSSPFSGGAVLGDRIRMKDLNRYENVYVRSLSSRGKVGGLSYFTADVVNLFDALGFDVIIIETVGSGQDEIDIYNIAHTIVVIQVPTLGDEVQVIKAGQMEIGDIFVVNKADQGPADEKIREIETLITPRENGWIPKIIKTVAVRNQNIDELKNAIEEHYSYLKKNNMLYEKLILRLKYLLKQHITFELDNLMDSSISSQIAESLLKEKSITGSVNEILKILGEKYGEGRNI
ncbi:MAG: methylmalonyl Co-A mutase-associated GTPase MeaB [Thermoplasmata archaeon]